tara:strand:- start:5279 stop:5845 length:567 start_codon:yes stop_codon:yes gene_type:complete
MSKQTKTVPQCKGCPSPVDKKSEDTGKWWEYCDKCYKQDQEEEEEYKCCMCYDDVRNITFWGCDTCGLNVCASCAINEEGVIQCGHMDCCEDKPRLTDTQIVNLEKELTDLFPNESVYFRNNKEKNGITERSVRHNGGYAFICCEGGTEKICDYYENYGGCRELNNILKKYDVYFEWEDCCVISIYDY